MQNLMRIDPLPELRYPANRQTNAAESNNKQLLTQQLGQIKSLSQS